MKNLTRRKNLLTIGTIMFFGVLIWACKAKDYDSYLPTPTNIKADPVEDGIKVSWDSVEVASSYQLYVRRNGSYLTYSTVYKCSTVFEAKADGQYSFQVRAYNYDVNEYSEMSEEVFCDYTNPNILRTPTGLTAKQVKDSIKVSWDPVKVAERYYLSASNNKGWSKSYYCDYPNISFYNLTDGATYSFKVKAYRGNESTDWSNTASCVYSEPTGGSTTGTYMGIIGFNDELNEKSISLLTDNKNTYNTNSFTSFVRNLKAKPATSLYYAVDNAINRLESAVLPDDLANVSIVTFTDGLDNASIDLNTKYTSRDAYRDAVKKRITETKIKNLPINAYSIGVKGGDVNNVEAFRAALISMASDQNNAKEVANMSEVNKTFSDIASSLYNESKSQTVKLKITGGYDDGTKIRFTLDNVTNAAQSEFYIEGTYKRNGAQRTLQDLVYHGAGSSSGTTIIGEVSGLYVTFSFENFTIETTTAISLQNIKQWEYISATSQWQRNSEFGQTGDIETVVDKKSAVIILVLDCTTSLGSDFTLMKNAATNFIEVFTKR